MKQRKKYPKTASAFGVAAGALFVAGFLNFGFMFPAAFLGLIALILALGPDNVDIVYYDKSASWSNSMGNSYPIKTSPAGNSKS